MTAPAPTELLVFGFSPGESQFEGRLGGALERAESGGAIRVIRALFVGRESVGGEFAAIDLRDGTGGWVAPLLSFRLDPRERRKSTARALEGHVAGLSPQTLEELGAVLEPGEAIIAVLLEHAWAVGLADAVERSRGRALTDGLVPAGDAADFGRRVLAVSSRWSRRPAAPAAPGC